MTVGLSYFAGAGWQFFDDNGVPLSGGKLYTYDAGTTTPAATYTSSSGGTANPNPIILDSAGRPPAEIWLTSGSDYKFVVKSSTDVTIRTYDDLPSINDTSALLAFEADLANTSDVAKGDALVGFRQSNSSGALAGAVGKPVHEKFQESLSVLDFGAVGDGVTDDTAAIQAAIDAAANTVTKKVRVPYGAAGIYKLTDAVVFNEAGVTMEWDNNSIVFKKFYSTLGATAPGYGYLILVNAGYITLVNPGIDGNGDNYGGSGIAYNRSDTYFTFGCRIVNPNISETRDSCIVFFGPRGAPDIVIDGGTLVTWQDPAFAGASSSGFPAIRIVGAIDGDTSPRVFTNITASSTILLDATGMNAWKMSNCFTGTILYEGNPDATGGTDPYRTGESAVVNTYIRDGIVVAGFENSVENCLSHGNAPLTWTAYGGTPATYSTYGWEISNNSVLIKLGPNNVVTDQIEDNSPEGVATGLLSSYYTVGVAFAPVWGGSVADPSIGNGSIYCAYDAAAQYINFRMKLTTGSTTTFGTGDWTFTLPKRSSTPTTPVGVWSGYLFGVERVSGYVVVSSTGSTHKISLLLADGKTVVGSTAPASIPVGSEFVVNLYYLRG